MFKITFKMEGGEDVTIFAAHGEDLLSVARKANVAIDAPCSGNGSCGKCRVRLLDGEAESTQSRHITDAEYAGGWRLACYTTVSAEAEFLVPDIASAYKSRMKVADVSSPEEMAVFRALQDNLAGAGIAPGCGVSSLVLKLDEPSLYDTMPDNERLTRAILAETGAGEISLPYHVQKKLPDVLRAEDFSVRCILERRGDSVTLLDAVPGTDATPACGFAVDIGTTSVTGLLVDLESGAILAKASTGNGQIRYGADVINRIIEQQRPGGTEKLQRAIVEETLSPLIAAACRDAGVMPERIYRMTVASNTTMNHLFLGCNANPLRMEPYIPAFFEADPVPASGLGLPLSPSCLIALAPNIGSYVGGDVTAGALMTMLWNTEKNTMLVDLGTNGEIVFGNSDFLVACACSAGPAFEGGDISCGMRATDGAIEACAIDGATMDPAFSVIGGAKPVGLCGSGIIDVIAELFRTGIINGRGKFSREGARVQYDEYGSGRYILAFPEESQTERELSISEVDIDNFIRAKGAIFSAIMTMITPLGFAPEDIGRVYVAGGIGSGINMKNAVGIGMFPDLPAEKYDYVGNTSLAGAYAMLASSAAREKLSEVARNITYIELSTEPGYMDAFIAACFLPHTDAALFPSSEVESW